jgi:putative ABC transport system ATP-binding protein
MDKPLKIRKQSAKTTMMLEFRVSCVRVIKILKLFECWRSTLSLSTFPGQFNFHRQLSMSNNPILSVEHLSKVFKSGDQPLTVLSDVSFAIEEGSACAIIGPSGSGKTTLIAICAGLERPSEGSVIFDGIPIHLSSEEELAHARNRFIGFIFQSFQLLPSLTALENVMVPAEIGGENHARGRATELLQQVGLESRLHHYPVQLSGGEQQRVAIARAFMNRPKILFADEPTGNLDAETAKEIVRLIFQLNATTGTTLILVTHDPDLTRHAGRVIGLKAGRLVADSGAQAKLSAER